MQSLAEREKAVTYKALMRHLRCGAEIEALFSAQQATSFLPAQSKEQQAILSIDLHFELPTAHRGFEVY